MSLRRRLEQQAHWEQADAVREGRQLPIDPDGGDLEELGDGYRLYRVNRVGTEPRRVCKRLVDGRWQRVEVDVPGEHDEGELHPTRAANA
jgi:hypothetical protein